MMMIPKDRKCHICGSKKTKIYAGKILWHKLKDKNDNHIGYMCRTCYTKKYNQENSEYIKQHLREWRYENPDTSSQHSLNYQARNKLKVSQYKKKYQQEHKDKLAAYMREYRAKKRILS